MPGKKNPYTEEENLERIQKFWTKIGLLFNFSIFMTSFS